MNSTDDFRQAIESTSGRDLSRFFDPGVVRGSAAGAASALMTSTRGVVSAWSAAAQPSPAASTPADPLAAVEAIAANADSYLSRGSEAPSGSGLSSVRPRSIGAALEQRPDCSVAVISVPGEFAAAVETSASMGGLIMPPVMAVAGFVMAEFLGVPYWQVALRGFALAFIYYSTLALSVYLVSTRLMPSDPIEKTSIPLYEIPYF